MLTQIDWTQTPIDLASLIGKSELLVHEKMAFLVYHADVLHHYEPVLRQFRPEEVDLVLHAKHGCEEQLFERVAQLPYHWVLSKDLLASLTSYRYLVSTNYLDDHELILSLENGQQSIHRHMLISLLGHYNIRFMYCLGIDGWNLEAWNHIYDAFLCFGEFQARQLSRFPGKKFLMGYPRYDAFFNQSFDRAPWLRRLGCDPDKPIVVWLSTLKMGSGVLDLFALAVSQLSCNYNVLVKPHPLSWPMEPNYLSALNGLNFCAVLQDIDNLILFQLADFVITDYGGTAYSALYTDCNLLLLDHPEFTGQATEDPLASETDAWLRRHIIHIEPKEADRLPDLLADQAYWQAQKQKRAELRSFFFASYYGNSAQIAADLLKQMPQLLVSKTAQKWD